MVRYQFLQMPDHFSGSFDMAGTADANDDLYHSAASVYIQRNRAVLAALTALRPIFAPFRLALALPPLSIAAL